METREKVVKHLMNIQGNFFQHLRKRNWHYIPNTVRHQLNPCEQKTLTESSLRTYLFTFRYSKPLDKVEKIVISSLVLSQWMLSQSVVHFVLLHTGRNGLKKIITYIRKYMTKGKFVETFLVSYLDHSSGPNPLLINTKHLRGNSEDLRPPLSLKSPLHFGKVKGRLGMDLAESARASGNKGGEVYWGKVLNTFSKKKHFFF